MVSASPARLLIGQYQLTPPVVLAPMAGITNAAFRTLCREQGAGLFISEMVTARALVERHPETLRMITPAPGESPRSVQLYTVHPQTVRDAVRMLVSEGLTDHIDLNFGCPVPKVTRKGGGSALPFKRKHFAAIVNAAVSAAEDIPVTVKMRKGIDDEHLTYLEAGKTAAQEGVHWVALHARTAAQMYGGKADWSAIARLKEELAPFNTPVLGNGDIWTGADGVRMMQETGCDGVVVGRGCLGRPWLFAELVAAFNGDNAPALPNLRQVGEVMLRHANLLAEYFHDELRGCRDFRKHVAWYLKGFTVKNHLRVGLAEVSTLAQMKTYIDEFVGDQPFPTEIATGPRGRTTTTRAVSLPDGWLNDPDEIFSVNSAPMSESVTDGG
mgnify:FL=1